MWSLSNFLGCQLSRRQCPHDCLVSWESVGVSTQLYWVRFLMALVQWCNGFVVTFLWGIFLCLTCQAFRILLDLSPSHTLSQVVCILCLSSVSGLGPCVLPARYSEQALRHKDLGLETFVLEVPSIRGRHHYHNHNAPTARQILSDHLQNPRRRSRPPSMRSPVLYTVPPLKAIASCHQSTSLKTQMACFTRNTPPPAYWQTPP